MPIIDIITILKAAAFFKGIKVLKDYWNNGILSFKLSFW